MVNVYRVMAAHSTGGLGENFQADGSLWSDNIYFDELDELP